MKRCLWPAVFVAVLACGCGRSQPVLSGGKPVAYWVQALRQDPDAWLRKEAAAKLGNAGPIDATVLPALMNALKDPDTAVRCEAVRALLKFGPDAKQAEPALADLRQGDPDAGVRDCASKALEKIRRPG
jgi:HEAT repeat protein